MANFNSLPKAIRKRIYELHLTQEESITLDQYKEHVGFYGHYKWGRSMPALLQVSRRIDKEAAPFYYANNDFEFGSLADIEAFAFLSWPRHRHLVRKITVKWSRRTPSASERFRVLASMKSLEELYIRVNERHMLSKLLEKSRHNFQSHSQQNILMLQHPGVAGLLKLRIPKVRFIKLVAGGKTRAGPIPGGALETIVAPRIMGLNTAKEK
ncbi:hypothetical protein KC332_g14017 [Hortaea werneckii]|nr:hypothetical protein KC358_g14054 [Hortaea werneckii]KAI6807531.1 hypothetical protein KC350_g13747 [Hortaea werneckii]KAI6907982.1 hypothetical protein KC348_g14030 [Hortaea werneckii]KAI6924986.1 hypothetical protein KC341_g13721 [Hortaea werneckii]KAI6958563.1 hypothetical protein KC321_g13939 [Hortaea werneckii]